MEKSYLDPYFCDQKAIFPSLLKSKHVSAAVTKKQQEYKTLKALPSIAFPEISKGTFFFFFFPIIFKCESMRAIPLQCNGPQIKLYHTMSSKNVHHSLLKLLVSFYLAFFLKSHNLDKAQL